jgi:glycerol-3-phosphate acyltransferase PlsY
MQDATAIAAAAMGDWAVAWAAAFAAGSIPFGLLIGRLKGIDIREHGSRNIGATNVGRVLGRGWGLTCFALDFLKGALPVIVAASWLIPGWPGSAGAMLADASPGAIDSIAKWWPLTAVAAVLGHVLSPWVGFRGGKGVATSFGALCAMWPLMTLPVLVAFAIWLVAVAATRYVSLGSILAAAALPPALIVHLAMNATLAPFAPLLLGTFALSVLVVWKHRNNIGRLLAGTESRIGRRSGAAHSAAPGGG